MRMDIIENVLEVDESNNLLNKDSVLFDLSLFLLRNSCLQPTRYARASHKLVFPNNSCRIRWFSVILFFTSFLPT
ncbi:hypothetical protein PHAVU_003G183900 [Phaseolus vulgaris]|uniref:Uncharacterized protein n=1 Tax=Phaseolus vulgaris TaxID=3885 RepID=V7CD77_PHAVU|nr:hypothetical protein PHAVU_003G183900g [Phaseolus vulgaris]ESW27220.1 hypothetical protein PHAVU_003G183900g [Phaseolus vulgaris]